MNTVEMIYNLFPYIGCPTWENFCVVIDGNQWRHGRHFGKCIGVEVECLRCLAEKYSEIATHFQFGKKLEKHENVTEKVFNSLTIDDQRKYVLARVGKRLEKIAQDGKIIAFWSKR